MTLRLVDENFTPEQEPEEEEDVAEDPLVERLRRILAEYE